MTNEEFGQRYVVWLRLAKEFNKNPKKKNTLSADDRKELYGNIAEASEDFKMMAAELSKCAAALLSD